MSTKSNPKLVLILETGKTLFWKYGFKRVTIEEICKEAGISKMTYYKFFSNKMELVKTLMDQVLQTSMKKYRDIMESDVPYPDKVVAMIELKREQTHTMSSEFYRDYIQSGDPELISYLEEMSASSLKMFTDDFRKAQEKGDIRQDLKVEFILIILNKMIDWVQHDHSLIELYERPEDLAVEMTNFLFYGLLNRDVHP